MYNTETKELEENIINLINNCNLHTSTIKLIIDKISKAVDEFYERDLEIEKNKKEEVNQE